MKVVLGEFNLLVVEGFEQTFGVIFSIKNPGFNNWMLLNDIMLLKVRTHHENVAQNNVLFQITDCAVLSS